MDELDKEVRACRDCGVYSDEYDVPKHLCYLPDGQCEVWMLPNGMFLSFEGSGAIPLHTEYAVCQLHSTKLWERFNAAT